MIITRHQLRKRSDVKAHQLDDSRNTLTDVDEDNCDQEISGGAPYYKDDYYDFDDESEGPANLSWTNSSLSKRYTKNPPTTIEELGIRFVDNTQ